MRQIVLAQSDLDLHAGVGIVTQDLHNTSYRLRALARLLQNLQHHHLPRRRATVLARGDQDVLTDAPILGHNELDAVLFVHPPNQALGGVLQHLHDASLTTPTPVDAGFANQHNVAVQHLVHLLGTDHQVNAAVIRDQEPKAVRVALHLPLDQVELVGYADRPLAVAHYLTVALHGAQATREQLDLVLFDA